MAEKSRSVSKKRGREKGQPKASRRSDASIAALISRGEHRQALVALAEAYAAEVGRLCAAFLGDRGEAEELAQEILLAAHRAMPAFEGRSSVRRWLYSIARRSCAKALDRRQRRGILARRAEAEAALQADLGPDPEAEVIAARELQQLREALAGLKDGPREVLLLRYVSGLSYREIGVICEIREDTARQRAATGLRALRRTFRRSAQAERGAATSSSQAEKHSSEDNRSAEERVLALVRPVDSPELGESRP